MDAFFPILRGSSIRLIDVTRLYSTPDDVTSKEYMPFYYQTLSFYLVAQYLLYINLEYGDLCISIIINSLKSGGNNILMVLGETFNGLKLVHDESSF